MVESHALDIGFVSQLLPSNDLLVTPLYKEPMLVLSAKGTFKEKELSLSRLDPAKEIYARWSDEFALWHDTLWPGQQYHMHVGTGSMLPDYLNQTGRWAIAPVSILQGSAAHNGFDYHFLKEQPPKRTFYQVESRQKRPGRMAVTSLFKQKLYAFLEEDPDIEICTAIQKKKHSLMDDQ